MIEFPNKILLVEVDVPSRIMVESALLSIGQSVELRALTEKEQVVDELNRFKADIVLLETDLGDQNGVDVLEAIQRHEELTRPKIVFFTKHKKIEMLPHYRAVGIIGIIYKPISAKEFTEQLTNIWQSYIEDAAKARD
jgi:DNA-binding response OmpR family regulator